MKDSSLFSPCLVYITSASADEAALIARTLVEERLAACCSIIPSIRSLYHWNGSLQDDQEALILCKTSQNVYADLETRVKQLHSYQVPEILMVPVSRGLPDYLAWMNTTMDSDRP